MQLCVKYCMDLRSCGQSFELVGAWIDFELGKAETDGKGKTSYLDKCLRNFEKIIEESGNLPPVDALMGKAKVNIILILMSSYSPFQQLSNGAKVI